MLSSCLSKFLAMTIDLQHTVSGWSSTTRTGPFRYHLAHRIKLLEIFQLNKYSQLTLLTTVVFLSKASTILVDFRMSLALVLLVLRTRFVVPDLPLPHINSVFIDQYGAYFFPYTTIYITHFHLVHPLIIICRLNFGCTPM